MAEKTATKVIACSGLKTIVNLQIFNNMIQAFRFCAKH